MEHKGNIFKPFFGVPPPPGYNSESIVLESATVIHGENCSCCTSKKDSQKFGEEYERRLKQLHKGKYKGVRALRAKKQQEKQQEQDEDLFACLKEKQDEPDPLGDLEPI